MNNTIVHLIGYPGVGKLTVARELCALTNAKLLDNHLILNTIFGLIEADGKTPIPDPIWDQIDIIRDATFRAIELAAKPARSFVLTNVLTDEEPLDREIYQRVVVLAERRQALFVPIILVADTDEILRRIPSADRAANLKHIDVPGSKAFMAENSVLTVDHPNTATFDTTGTAPADTAAAIVTHIKRLAQ
ncbi:hypothetical protein FF80_02785 [Devosia sp. LC5]|uniref:AAA family ATPase n=1 Tax=Devosia sp. LC5 TaxID=1502724 RepID=UPI0004E46318|nr:AAA family ATPase [Devosia sp. LC5]KFC65717.1 hypothetical protein FF80_02785 [Devosia sp. LC5]